MKILITGSDGFIGSHLVKACSKEGHELVKEDADHIDAVLHQAAITKTFDVNEKEMLESNLHYPMKLFPELLKKGCRTFVGASSTAVYGNAPAPHKEDMALSPLNPYGESKKLFEEFAVNFGKRNKVNIILLRYCNVFGSNEAHKGAMASMIYQLIVQIKSGKQPKLFIDGSQRRDWIEVTDICRANLLALKYKGINIFNCGSGYSTPFNTLIQYINSALGTNAEPLYIDNPHIGTYQEHTECDMSKSSKLLKFYPKITLLEGINRYVHYLAES